MGRILALRKRFTPRTLPGEREFGGNGLSLACASTAEPVERRTESRPVDRSDSSTINQSPRQARHASQESSQNTSKMAQIPADVQKVADSGSVLLFGKWDAQE